jgi:hypothetical protein
MNFKRCSTVAALLMASAIPAVAQEVVTEIQPIEIPADVVVPENHILLQFTDTEGFFVVSYENAAEICGITEADFAIIAEDPATGLIYCEELADPVLRQTFVEEGRIVPLTDFEDSDDDDDDGEFADDAEETAVDEANDEDGDGIFDEDDDDMDEDDGLIDNDDADPNDDDMDNGDDMDGGGDTGSDMSGDDDANGSPDSNSDDS